MSRLFVGPRELNFISDITKEIVKDVIGQRVFYYPISERRTQAHAVYNESTGKVHDGPIEVDCLVDNNFQSDTKTDKFGIDSQFRLELFLHYRDLVDKGINVAIGDFFSFSDVFYEVVERVFMRNIYGMPEHKDGVKIVGVKARQGLFDSPVKGPTDIKYTDPGAVQETFVQQRGYSTDDSGEATGDKRDLVENGVLDSPLTGKREVSPKGDETDAGSSFYDE